MGSRQPVFAASAAAPQSLKTELPAALRTDLMGWFDAADETTVVREGDGVSLWKDKSGKGHDLVQPLAANRPLDSPENGVPVMHGGNRTMLAAGVNESGEQMTVHALISVAPGNTPILGFTTQGKPEFIAAGWTIGAHPSIYSAAGITGARQELEDSRWHVLTFIRNKAQRAYYIDGVFAGDDTSKDETLAITDFHLFAYQTAATFSGNLAELLIYHAAQDAGQVAGVTTYLRTKWAPLFPDTKTPLTAFVGNSLTTGMFCGNGQTWSHQTAAKIPAIQRWYTVSQGGITTQRLAALAAGSVDPLLQFAAGSSALVFWEGTNELVVNKATPEAAVEATKQFCLARRKAGWKKIVVMTVLPREAPPEFEVRRVRFNALMREHYAEYADALVDIDTNHEVGDDGDNRDKTYYADGVHLNVKGNGIVADLVAAKLAQLVAP